MRVRTRFASMAPLRPRSTLRLAGKGFEITPHHIEVLDAIRRTRSLSGAARSLHVSYKHLWSSVQDAEKGLGRSLVSTKRGGTGGGGQASLTEYAARLLRDYNRTSSGLTGVLKEESFWEALGLKLSVRNRLPGVVRQVTRDRVAARVVIDVKASTRITALVTREAVDDLGIEVGDRVEALVKSTEVMLAKRG
jgi:molybdate transport system regulatory protein